ncbi:MAG: hypothetical protein P1U56_12325 [Saprospiraceae bacterium]|nr:hypothetical protein [Saprospiraceae bacterium]
MNTRFILFLSVVLSLACTVNYTQSKTQSEANPMIFSERVGENLFVFRQNESSKIVEYILIQGTTDNPVGITDFSISNDGREVSIRTGAQNWVYALDDDKQKLVYGIGHFVQGEGVDRAKILQELKGLGTEGRKKNCDSACRDGGCGSIRCSKKVNFMSSSITCSNGYFACCADMVAEGCHCKKDDCCDATSTAPTTTPKNK